VRLFVSAGEALPRPIFERWKARFGAEILDGIGSTEIGYIAISNFAGRARAGTSGEVIPGYEAKVAGADGAPVEAGEVGDLMGREDAEGIVQPAAYVVLRNGDPSEGLAGELRAFVKDRLAPYKYPRWIEFVPELPKTSTGKVQRYKLRQP